MLAAVLAAAAICAGPAAPGEALAQGMLKLDPPAPSYTLGRFRYEPPRVDGWRQISNFTNSLSLVYAEQKEENLINTVFGVEFQAHDIPPNADVPPVAGLAAMSRSQMLEQRKDSVVRAFDVEPVPSMENMARYRLLVHAPVAGMEDAYEVYYVTLSPDKKQYLVAQCITKEQGYENQIYWNQFFASLASIRYDATLPAAPAPAPAVP